jgi:hypothetical protein
MQGRRLYPGPDGFIEFARIQAGDYFIDPINGQWTAMTPNGFMANLSGHTVTEHDDGTITASPSILVRGGPNCATELWHGFLERGVWREC